MTNHHFNRGFGWAMAYTYMGGAAVLTAAALFWPALWWVAVSCYAAALVSLVVYRRRYGPWQLRDRRPEFWLWDDPPH